MIYKFLNFIPEELLETVAAQVIQERVYQYGAISTNPFLPIWKGGLQKESEIAEALLSELHRRLPDQKFEITDCHINLQTIGLDAAFHIDSCEDGTSHALTWYCHNEWTEEMGGYLLIGEDVTDLKAILPVRNMAVLMPASIPHKAQSPARLAAHTARVSITLKLKQVD